MSLEKEFGVGNCFVQAMSFSTAQSCRHIVFEIKQNYEKYNGETQVMSIAKSKEAGDVSKKNCGTLTAATAAKLLLTALNTRPSGYYIPTYCFCSLRR